MFKKLPFFILFVSVPHFSNGQVGQQVWAEYMLTHPFANSWELEHTVTYGTLLNTPRWRMYQYEPAISWSYSQHIDAIGSVTLSYTSQTASVNTFEVRPMVGVRLHFTPNKRILTRLLLRFENRNVENIETKDWTSSNRGRIRLESLIPINNPTMFNKDKLWYGIVDAEWFIVIDKDVDERFANRFRFRSGAGYRINYNFRLEFLYTYQISKNQMEDASITHDNLYRIRIRHFINKSKPSKTLGVGN